VFTQSLVNLRCVNVLTNWEPLIETFNVYIEYQRDLNGMIIKVRVDLIEWH